MRLRNGLITLAYMAGLASCSHTSIDEHVGPGSSKTISPAQLGHVLLVIETALPTPSFTEQASQCVREAVAFLPHSEANSDTESHLLQIAQSQHLNSVLIIRAEDYQFDNNFGIYLSLLPIRWTAQTAVSIRIKALDAKSGTVLADLRKDRVTETTYKNLFTEERSEEMKALIASILTD